VDFAGLDYGINLCCNIFQSHHTRHLAAKNDKENLLLLLPEEPVQCSTARNNCKQAKPCVCLLQQDLVQSCSRVKVCIIFVDKRIFFAQIDGNPQDLDKEFFFAQIALDLPVILGLTMMAVGTTMQRGVGDYNLVVSVILLCTTLGLTTHITNVLRLLHMRVQAAQMRKIAQGAEAPSDSSEEKKSLQHVNAIRYNCIIIGLINAVMLVIF
jgi:hypothetical protein